jgi:hypothetical protein
MPVLLVMNMPTPLLKIQPPPTRSDIPDTSIKTAGFAGNPFCNIHWLAKEDIENQSQTHNHIHTTNMAHSPPTSFGTYQTTATPFKHICIFSINWELLKLKRTTMRTTRPS